MAEQIRRAIAYKLRIGDLLLGKPIIENDRMNFLELGNRHIIRVNIIANIIDKFEQEIENPENPEIKRKYLSFTIDDASGQIRIKAFADDVEKFKNIEQGNTVMVVGMLRFFNNEVYIQPEIIRILDPRYLLVRKLELEKETPAEIRKEGVKAVKDRILEMIKSYESEGGIDTDKLIMEINSSPEIINQEITKLLEEGLVYEPRPGKIRYLG